MNTGSRTLQLRLAGLRATELGRLDCKEIHLDRGYIEVSAAKSKTASGRLVMI